MRYVLVPACALLLLSGCGRNPADPPQAAINSGRDKSPPDGKQQGSSSSDKEKGPDATKGTPQGKQPGGTPSGASTFGPADARRTLDWLIHHFAKVRATRPDDPNALEREWGDFTRALKAAHKQKVSWTVPLYSVEQKGVVANWVKSDGDPACKGLRVLPDQQPADFVRLLLEVPGGVKSGQFHSGDQVLITGVVERIEMDVPGKSPAHAKTYGFHVRLSDYTIRPRK
jgi:hypothetical protein